MTKTPERYIPALNFRWLTRFYDPFIRLTLRENHIKSALVEQVGLQPSHRLLDIGAGTGTLALMLKQSQPGAGVTGVDGDPEILAIAKAKASQAGLAVTFDEGMAFALPYADGAYDHVTSSLVFHHLTRDQKQRALREVYRVLKPGGELHLLDFGRPLNGLMRVLSRLVQWGHYSEAMTDNVTGRLPDLFREAGFVDVQETKNFGTVYGTLTLYRAKKPKHCKE